MHEKTVKLISNQSNIEGQHQGKKINYTKGFKIKKK
jgi:hypothetical protein